MLELCEVGFRVGEKWLVRGASVRFEPGSAWGILGPNGAGKSTLLRMIAGELPPSAGEISLLGRPLTAFAPRELAKQRGVLAQRGEGKFPFTAHEIALMGRQPHLTGNFETARDHEIATDALRAVDAETFAARTYPTLSGGEAHRVDMARVLAQQPKIFILDEPTNHLDPHHQLHALRNARALADDGATVIAALHDLNLASLFLDRVVLMRDGQIIATGAPGEVLTSAIIRETYGIEVAVWRHPSGCPWVVPLLDAVPPASVAASEVSLVSTFSHTPTHP